MNTTTPVEVLFTAAEVAKLAGVDALDLPKFHPDYFGSPGHWRMGAGVLYTEKGVEGLAVAFQLAGFIPGAEALVIALHAKRVEQFQARNTPARALLDPIAKNAPIPEAQLPYYQRGDLA